MYFYILRPAGYVAGIIADGRYAAALGQIDGPLVVKLLRDDGEAVLPENLLGPHDGVERTESGIVEHDAVGRHPVGHQRIAHAGGLVVVAVVIVAAHQNIVNLARLEQPGRSLDTIVEVVVMGPLRSNGRRAQQQPHGTVRYRIDRVERLVAGIPLYQTVTNSYDGNHPCNKNHRNNYHNHIKPPFVSFHYRPCFRQRR